MQQSEEGSMIADHPFAEIFPLLDDEALERLAEDIKANGLNNPITLYEEKILDGRNRYRACLHAGLEPSFVEFQNGDPISFVISSNAQRRDLTKAQRAAVAVLAEPLIDRVKAAALDRKVLGGKVKAKLPDAEKRQSRDDLAKLFGVSARYIQDAFAIKALPEKLAELTRRKEPQWKAMLEEFPNPAAVFNDVFRGEKTLAEAKLTWDKLDYRKRQIEAEIKLAERAEVILADPPWRYENPGSESRKIENHYDTQDLETIKAHKPVTADDCVLFLWAPAPQLEAAIEVMNAWGFLFRTQAVWDKQVAGMGLWFRVRHENLLVGIRGHPKHANESLRVESIFTEKRTEHSVKPQCVYEWIDKVFADRVRLEMYARTKRPGWMSWGDEF